MPMKLEDAFSEMREWLALKMRTGRFSRLLNMQLAVLYISRMAHVHRILDQIEYIEEPAKMVGGTKPSTRFLDPPLKGLWHQHWFEPRFLPQNLINDLHSGMANQMLADMSDAVNRGDDLDRFAYDSVIGRYQSRYNAYKMTGELIVFAQVDGINYYLTLALHHEGKNRREGDRLIFERVKSCIEEFPEIITCVAEAQA
jgi:hypothetical protein